MKQIKENIFLVEGDLYTNMNLDPTWLSKDTKDNVVHAKGDIFFGVLRHPKLMKETDYYLEFTEFTSKYGPIYDLFCYSEL